MPNGAQALMQTLADAGVSVCFSNPGTSEMHFVAALDHEPRMRAVLTLFVPGSAAPVTVDYPAASPLVLRDACFRKSDAGTEVHLSVHYR